MLRPRFVSKQQRGLRFFRFPMKTLQPADIHIGLEIKAKMKEQEHSVTWFARQLHCDRTNVYDIFRRHDIDTALLMRICHILNFDFFSLFSEYISENIR